MIWHDLTDPNDPQLDELAKKYKLHPLHIEDCRHGNQSAKVERLNDYTFVILKPVDMGDDFEPHIGDLDVFAGPDYVITVEEMKCKATSDALQHARELGGDRPDQMLHRIADSLVDSYMPVLDRISDRIDELQDKVVDCAEPKLLQELFQIKRALIHLRRVTTTMRDVINQIQRLPPEVIKPDLQPFFRDVYDHVARTTDMVEMQRDLISGSMDIYLSSVSNRINQVMKVLTVISTITLPAIVISGVYGMNLKHLPFQESPHAWGIVTGMIFGISAILLALMRKSHWL